MATLEGGKQPIPDLGLAPAQSIGWADAQRLEPQYGTDFLSLRTTKPRGLIAVVSHVYYPELWPELSGTIANIEEPFDLFVTLVAGRSDTLAQAIVAEWPSAHVIVVENRGRDILPFFSIVRTGVLFRYKLICKLHTKRSEWHADGETWRKELVNGILGSQRAVRLIVSTFRSQRDLGMVVADGHMYSGRELWEGNRDHLTRLFADLGMDQTEFNNSFAGGSIFWIRPAVLRLISGLPFRFGDFEPEPLGKDGHLVHAIERLVSLACYELGMTIKQTSAILPPDAPRGNSL
jgi:lipopolysaccharide biosynthesis protein